jgi:hypothetical protein
MKKLKLKLIVGASSALLNTLLANPLFATNLAPDINSGFTSEEPIRNPEYERLYGEYKKLYDGYKRTGEYKVPKKTKTGQEWKIDC